MKIFRILLIGILLNSSLFANNFSQKKNYQTRTARKF